MLHFIEANGWRKIRCLSSMLDFRPVSDRKLGLMEGILEEFSEFTNSKKYNFYQFSRKKIVNFFKNVLKM